MREGAGSYQSDVLVSIISKSVVWLIPVNDSGRAVLDRRERLPLYFAEDHPA
jgi:hypothetical protein